MRERILGAAVLLLVLTGTLMFWKTRTGPARTARCPRTDKTLEPTCHGALLDSEDRRHQRGKQPLGSESILLIVQARVDAGINLDLMRPQE